MRVGVQRGHLGLGHELRDKHGVYVYGASAFNADLGLGHELGDKHGECLMFRCGRIGGVQRGHLGLGHELRDRHRRQHVLTAASAFNVDISGWDTSSVTNMRVYVYVSPAFNADISGWDTSSRDRHAVHVYGAWRSTRTSRSWDTSSVTDMWTACFTCVGGVQRGHLGLGHELGDKHGVHVYVSVGVQRGHIGLGHELRDKQGTLVRHLPIERRVAVDVHRAHPFDDRRAVDVEVGREELDLGRRAMAASYVTTWGTCFMAHRRSTRKSWAGTRAP